MDAGASSRVVDTRVRRVLLFFDASLQAYAELFRLHRLRVVVYLYCPVEEGARGALVHRAADEVVAHMRDYFENSMYDPPGSTPARRPRLHKVTTRTLPSPTNGGFIEFASRGMLALADKLDSDITIAAVSSIPERWMVDWPYATCPANFAAQCGRETMTGGIENIPRLFAEVFACINDTKAAHSDYRDAVDADPRLEYDPPPGAIGLFTDDWAIWDNVIICARDPTHAALAYPDIEAEKLLPGACSAPDCQRCRDTIGHFCDGYGFPQAWQDDSLAADAPGARADGDALERLPRAHDAPAKSQVQAGAKRARLHP
jgi:hypothetical protein